MVVTTLHLYEDGLHDWKIKEPDTKNFYICDAYNLNITTWLLHTMWLLICDKFTRYFGMS